MGFDLVWTGDQIDKVSEDFSVQVSDNLESALEDKQRQIEWSRNMADLRNRFQEVIRLNGLIVAEIRFSAMSAEYRALCIVLPEREAVFYYTTVPKKGSHQQRKLQLMRRNSDEIENYFSEKY